MRDGLTYRHQGQRMLVRVEWAQYCAKQGGTAGLSCPRRNAGTVFLYPLSGIYLLCDYLFVMIILGGNYEKLYPQQTMALEFNDPNLLSKPFYFVKEK